MSEQGYEQEYVKEAFDTNWIAPLGKNVDSFEKELAEYVGAEHTVALSSGSAAIHLALIAADVQPNDIVLCQSLTFSASANPIIYQHATPVFIDSEEDTWNMDPTLLEEALEKYPQTKAVIVVNLYGMSAQLDKIKNLCQKHDVVLIEDAAESLGTFYKGKSTGLYGDYGIFSFNGNKIITTSGGGMLVCPTKEIADKVRFWATQARDKAIHYQHSELGFNYRLSNISAGIGRGQLKVLNDRVDRKNEIYNTYKQGLKDLKQISFMPEYEEDTSNRWLSVIVLDDSISSTDLYYELDKHNIESRPVWKPMHLQPFFEKYDSFINGVSEKLFKNGLCLPSDTKMTSEEQEKVIKVIRNFINECI